VLQWRFPQLYSFALNENISVKFFRARTIERLFWHPLSIEASMQLEELQRLIQGIQTDPLEKICGAIYEIQMSTQVRKPIFK
jgi:hypothetical protein